MVSPAAGGLSGDYSNVGATAGTAARASQDINSTYYELTTLAAKYGAHVPRSVVQ